MLHSSLFPSAQLVQLPADVMKPTLTQAAAASVVVNNRQNLNDQDVYMPSKNKVIIKRNNVFNAAPLQSLVKPMTQKAILEEDKQEQQHPDNITEESDAEK